MSEYRADPVTGHWRVVAEGRLARPNEYIAEEPRPPPDEQCPFCEGNEDRTPPEVDAVRPGNGPANGSGWTVRVIPNRYPTVSFEPIDPIEEIPHSLVRRPGTGVHEVIIESPRHAPALPYLPADHLREVFRMFRKRVRAASVRPSAGAVVLFENWGPESGGTLWHPHAQLVASDVPLPRIEEELGAFRRHAGTAGSGCLLEAVVAVETAEATRLVASDALFDVVAPFGSEHPYELWIVPHRHTPSFADANDSEVDRLGALLPSLLRALVTIRPRLSYNWFVHGVRADRTGTGDFHWHVEVAPRLVRPDGFELAAGTAVNPVSPESAAAAVRSALAEDGQAGPRKR